ncbi:hypothetical protein MRX96_037395 [Rhipicephalus microplus]
MGHARFRCFCHLYFVSAHPRRCPRSTRKHDLCRQPWRVGGLLSARFGRGFVASLPRPATVAFKQGGCGAALPHVGENWRAGRGCQRGGTRCGGGYRRAPELLDGGVGEEGPGPLASRRRERPEAAHAAAAPACTAREEARVASAGKSRCLERMLRRPPPIDQRVQCI